jgi:hypothetical protein
MIWLILLKKTVKSGSENGYGPLTDNYSAPDPAPLPVKIEFDPNPHPVKLLDNVLTDLDCIVAVW